MRRVAWTESEKHVLLEVLVEVQSLGVNVNNTSEWLKEEHGDIILSKLREARVNAHWLIDINKVKKAYMNIKAEYNKYRMLDRLHTVGGYRLLMRI